MKVAAMVEKARTLYGSGFNVVLHLQGNPDFEHEKELAIEIAYELQSGTYTLAEDSSRPYIDGLIEQLIEVLGFHNVSPKHLLDVGVGEATTLVALARELGMSSVSGIDISFSRLSYAAKRLRRDSIEGNLAVANMGALPFGDNEFDLVLTVHAMEPNGGRESDLINELARVTSQWVLLVEPDWDLADESQRKRMRDLGYIGPLRKLFISSGLELVDAVPILNNAHQLNRATIFLLRKGNAGNIPASPQMGGWASPENHELLEYMPDRSGLRSALGLLHPVVMGIPFLREEDALLALEPASF